jgi:hypothetical protein
LVKRRLNELLKEDYCDMSMDIKKIEEVFRQINNLKEVVQEFCLDTLSLMSLINKTKKFSVGDKIQLVHKFRKDIEAL